MTVLVILSAYNRIYNLLYDLKQKFGQGFFHQGQIPFQGGGAEIFSLGAESCPAKGRSKFFCPLLNFSAPRA